MDKVIFIINLILKFGSHKNKIKSIVFFMVLKEKVKHQPNHKTLQSVCGLLTIYIVAKELG